MKSRTLVLHLPTEDRLAQLVHIIRRITNSDAHVVGLHVTPGMEIFPGLPHSINPEAYPEVYLAYFNIAEACRESFVAAARNETFSSEWRQVEAGDQAWSDVVMSNVRCADLIVCNQPVPEDGHGLRRLTEQLILDSGRPVLIVPAKYETDAIGEAPIVAWNGSKEASRAVFDALPILTAASHTTILQVGSQFRRHKNTEVPLQRICQSLQRHGVTCEARLIGASDRSAGEEIEAVIQEEAADLLVMGGYGNSRMREYVLGGATRHMLTRMSIPVLLSH